MHAFLDDRFLPLADARVAALDRGFLFGDGVYEVYRMRHGALVGGALHSARLERGMAALRLARPRAFESPGVEALVRELLERNGLLDRDASVYLQVTRGAAMPRTHWFPPADTPPTLVAWAQPIPDISAQRERGVAAITRPDERWLRCDLKTLQLLPNTLAKEAARAVGAYDAIFVREGAVTEGSHTNVFALVDGELRTHPLDHRVLPGVTRHLVLDVARSLGVPVREEAIRVEELGRATELFFTGTTSDVLPIVAVDGATVGDGRPGPVARRLHEALLAAMG
jgi:D-alanine transaminase